MKDRINISTEASLKQAFKEVAKELGTNPSSLLNMFMAHTIKTRGVNFETGMSVDLGAFSDSEQEESKEQYENRAIRIWLKELEEWKTIDWEKVQEWVKSWWTDNELEKPSYV